MIFVSVSMVVILDNSKDNRFYTKNVGVKRVNIKVGTRFKVNR